MIKLLNWSKKIYHLLILSKLICKICKYTNITNLNFRSRTDFSMSKIIGTTNVQCYSMRYLTNVTTIGTKVPYLNNAYIAFNGKHKGFDQSTVYNLLQNKLKTVVLTFGASFAN